VTRRPVRHQQQTNRWQDRALCIGVADLDLFYSFDPDEQAAALDICNACPVRTQCLDAAYAEEAGTSAGYRWGIRGGRTSDERASTHRTAVRRDLEARRATGEAPPPQPRINSGARLPETTRKRLEWLIRDGHTNKAIAAELNINRSTVSVYRQRLGIPSPYHTTPPECGTRSAYMRHQRLDEPIDDACRKANTDANNRLRWTGTSKTTAL
jgi:DNA-binding CsgD family transcriptional regulator